VPVAVGDHDHLLAAWLAWFGPRWVASVAAALGGNGPAGGRAPVSAGVTGTLGARVGGAGRLMAAMYMVILPDRNGSNPTRAHGRQVGNYCASRWIPHRPAGSPIGSCCLAVPLQHGVIAPGLARAELRQQARPRL
jgi:hypothetical protein